MTTCGTYRRRSLDEEQREEKTVQNKCGDYLWYTQETVLRQSAEGREDYPEQVR